MRSLLPVDPATVKTIVNRRLKKVLTAYMTESGVLGRNQDF